MKIVKWVSAMWNLFTIYSKSESELLMADILIIDEGEILNYLILDGYNNIDGY